MPEITAVPTSKSLHSEGSCFEVAAAVREYLVSFGVAGDVISSVGRGFSMPVESNDTPHGRQQNRRVELIVSGGVIATSISANK
jgi:hypothetical protein